MSFWLSCETDQKWKTYQSTSDCNEYDVIIIGGGISGISTAYHLSLYGYRCAVLEKDGICSGATGHNGGIIKTAVSSLKEYSNKYGLDLALDILKYSTNCIQEIQNVVNNLGINCELRFRGSLTAASNPQEFEELMERFTILRQNGFSVEWWPQEICEFNTKRSNLLGGIYWPSGGNIWAAKFVFGLATKVVESGASIHTETLVHSVQQDSPFDPMQPRYKVSTNRGIFECSHVVYACNAWCRNLLPSLTDIIVPVRNQVIITPPLPRLWNFSIITNDGYEYMMQRPDGRIVLGIYLRNDSYHFIGGMRDISETKEYNSDNTSDLNRQMSEKLHNYLSQNYQLGISEGVKNIVEMEWIGIMGFTPDHQPLIGPLTKQPGQYILAGYSGHGMPVAFLAGKHIAQMIAGNFHEENKDIPEVERVLNHVYNPSRYGL